MVTLFDLGVMLTAPLGNSTTGHGDAGISNDITFGCVCVCVVRGGGGIKTRLLGGSVARLEGRTEKVVH